MSYNPWPLGHIPQHLQRIELAELKAKGYEYEDAREIVTMFEQKVADFAGARYAVAVDCCTHAIELSLRYILHTGQVNKVDPIILPENTYVSIPQTILRLFVNYHTEFNEWSGIYRLKGTNVIDGAVRWAPQMYVDKTLHCLSFQIKKPIPIGRGGMVLTDNKDAADWIRLASYDGRDLNTPYDSEGHVKMRGFHYYMTPEDAARGILLMDAITFEGDSANWTNYPKI